MVCVTLEEAYQRLGLTPLDTFIQNRMGFNRHGIVDPDYKDPRRGTTSYQYRGIGATTWMLVSAALRMEREDVIIVATDHQIERKLQDGLKDILERLGFSTEWRRENGMTVLAAQGNRAFFSTNNNGQEAVVVGLVGMNRVPAKPFEDVLWKTRAIRRVEGPFSMVREIRKKDGSWGNEPDKYQAFAEDDEFLFEMTEEGALDLLKANGDIRTRGWEPPKKKPNLQPFPRMANVITNRGQGQPGDIYYDETTGKLHMLDKNGVWIEVRGAGGDDDA